MTSSSLYDRKAINALLHDGSPIDLSLSSKTLEHIAATPNGYTQSIEFDTLPITGRWALLRDGWLQLPLTVTPTDAAAAKFSVEPVIAFKGSALSLINGISIKTTTGQTIVEERDSTVFSSHLRLMLEHHSDWYVSNGEQLLYSPLDRPEDGVRSGLMTGGTIKNPSLSRFLTDPTQADGGYSPLFNKAFAERRRMLLDSTIGPDNKYSSDQSSELKTVLNIPLRYIHSFFEALDFPIINTRLTITFWLNTTGNRSYQPMCLGTKEDKAIETGGSIVTAITPNSTPRLYYHSCTFNPEQQEQVLSALASGGFNKRVVYKTYDMNILDTDRKSTARFELLVSNGVVNPQKVFVMCFPHGEVNGVNWPNPIMTGAYGLRDVGLDLNGVQQYSNRIDTPAEAFALLKDILPTGLDWAAGGPLTYADFLKSFRILALDISRSGNRSLVDRNAPMRITLSGSPATADPIDTIVLVEKLQECVLQFGASDTLVMVGPVLAA